MSGRRMSVNLKKIKGNTQVNHLVQEYGRTPETADRYDDGHRMIDTSRTADNVVLLAPPDNYDRIRRERIEEINERRAGRADDTLKVGNKRRALSKTGELQAEASRNAVKTRKLRSDTVDTLGIVVQMPPEMADVWTREQQTQFFRDALGYMQEHPEEYGHIDAAVIHYDESSPHMQCLASTLDMDNLKSHRRFGRYRTLGALHRFLRFGRFRLRVAGEYLQALLGAGVDTAAALDAVEPVDRPCGGGAVDTDRPRRARPHTKAAENTVFRVDLDVSAHPLRKNCRFKRVAHCGGLLEQVFQAGARKREKSSVFHTLTSLCS